jgi:hypothetical protein
VPVCRGEPLVQRPGALLRKRSVKLLALRHQRCLQLLAALCECVGSVLLGCLICRSVLALVERKPMICAITVPITVRAPVMITATA